MDGRRFATATVAGGVVLFIASYVIWGLALRSFMMEHTMAGIAREPPRHVVLLVGQFATAALLCTVMGYWARTSGSSEGAKIGALLGFLVALSTDLTLNAITLVFDNLRVVAVDVFASTVVMAIGGAVVGALLARRS